MFTVAVALSVIEMPFVGSEALTECILSADVRFSVMLRHD